MAGRHVEVYYASVLVGDTNVSGQEVVCSPIGQV
jgi:hypothetical protein